MTQDEGFYYPDLRKSSIYSLSRKRERAGVRVVMSA
jgi:hypothetical protein